MTSEYPVVVYGASGYTGRLVIEYLREYSIPFVAAGRSRSRIEEALKYIPGIENADYQIAEVEHSVSALTELFSGKKVICNTVGPFSRFGETTIEAALAAGYSAISAHQQAHRLMKNSDVREQIAEFEGIRQQGNEITREYLNKRLLVTLEQDPVGQPSHADLRGAADSAARLNGLIVDKTEHSGAVTFEAFKQSMNAPLVDVSPNGSATVKKVQSDR